MKKIFAYTKDAELTPDTLAQITKAGYVPVPVANFDCIRVIEPIPDAEGSLIFNSAIRSLRESKSNLTRENFAEHI